MLTGPLSRPLSRPLAEPMFARRSSFSPMALFALGQQGAWYDPSDLSTLFQDAAGTIPVTATGQPVGLMRDKSGRGNHATQPTAASRPIFRDVGGLRYLECDGVDDGMVTGSINFTDTDKMFVCAGVRKLSDAATAVLLELSPNTSVSAGAFAVTAPNFTAEASYGSRSAGTTQSSAVALGSPSPISSVVSAISAISTDTNSIRVNGVQRATVATDQGAGNYSNNPLYLFRRGGTSLPFTGFFYGAIIAGAAYSAAQIASAERYLAGKSGVTL
jgi:hypothetical protein